MALPKFDVPTYELVIPSTKKKVEYRPYQVKEEKILMIALESNDEKQIIRATKNIVKTCLFDSVDVDKLTTFDMEYIFTKLRIKSVGETSTINAKCEKCEQYTSVDIDLENKIVIEGEIKKENKIDLGNKNGLIMKYPSINDVLLNFSDTQGSQVDQIFALISACIDTIYTKDEMYDAKDHTKEELNEFIESLDSSQFKKVQTFIEEMPQLVVPVQFTCSSCSQENDVKVRGLSNFFA